MNRVAQKLRDHCKIQQLIYILNFEIFSFIYTSLKSFLTLSKNPLNETNIKRSICGQAVGAW